MLALEFEIANKYDEAKEEKHLCYELTLNSFPPNTAQISPSAKQGHL